MVSYINDYLSKALSPYPHLSYARLPSWAHSSYKNNIEQNLDALPPRKPVSISLLSPGERERILQTFLRYELICRACCPRPVPVLVLNNLVDAVEDSDAPSVGEANWDELAYQKDEHFWHRSETIWNWHILPPFEQGWGKRPWDKDGLHCIHEYVGTLYGAMCPHNSNDWRESLFKFSRPHTSAQGYFVPSAYGFVGRNGSDHPYHPNLVGLLAGFGFDLVYNIIKLPSEALPPMLVRLDDEIKIRIPDS
jgi:hypothetical protein